MNEKSKRIYFLLILLLTISSVVSIYLPQNEIMSLQTDLPASKPIIALVNALIMLFLYGGLGYIGIRLSSILNYPDLWDANVSNRQRFYIPFLIGIFLGILLIIFDYFFSFYNGFGKLLHPSFPTSFFASLSAGIGEEVIFRLFFISFWVWLISQIILKGKYKNITFWIVTIFSSLLFAFAHLPSIMFLIGVKNVFNLSYILIIEIILLNSLISIPAAYYFKKFGILAAMSIHFWADIVWHVIYGLI